MSVYAVFLGSAWRKLYCSLCLFFFGCKFTEENRKRNCKWNKKKTCLFSVNGNKNRTPSVILSRGIDHSNYWNIGAISTHFSCKMWAKYSQVRSIWPIWPIFVIIWMTFQARRQPPSWISFKYRWNPHNHVHLFEYWPKIV